MRTDKTIYNDPNQRALLDAVVMNDVEETKAILAKLEDKSLLEDIGLLSKPFPLHYISLCSYAIWREVDEWKDKEMAKRNRDKTCAMVKFWKEYYSVSYFPTIDYRVYYDDFYCAYPDETDSDIMMGPIEEYIAHGAREIDIALYCAACRFRFDDVGKLLAEGANPNAQLFNEVDKDGDPQEIWTALDRIGGEESFLCCEIISILEELYKGIGKKWYIGESLLGNIVGLAAHSEMYRLLDTY